MPIAGTCPKCDSPYQVQDALAGKAVLCPQCQYRFDVPKQNDRTARRKPAIRGAASILFPISRLLVWGLAVVALLLGAALGAAMLSKAGNAIQEASMSALISAGLIFVYALARAASAIVDDVERLVRR
jgi:uncharacterized paraquat-inducible protein A